MGTVCACMRSCTCLSVVEWGRGLWVPLCLPSRKKMGSLSFFLGRGRLGGWEQLELCLGQVSFSVSLKSIGVVMVTDSLQCSASWYPHPMSLFLSLLFPPLYNQFSAVWGGEMWTGLRSTEFHRYYTHCPCSRLRGAPCEGLQSTATQEHSQGHGSWSTIWATCTSIVGQDHKEEMLFYIIYVSNQLPIKED